MKVTDFKVDTESFGIGEITISNDKMYFTKDGGLSTLVYIKNPKITVICREDDDGCIWGTGWLPTDKTRTAYKPIAFFIYP